MSDRSSELARAIDKTGYYPLVVTAGINAAVAGEEVLSFLVQHGPTISRDEVSLHITVVVLTPTRLILAHTDESPPDDVLPSPYTSTSTESVGLNAVRSVAVIRMEPPLPVHTSLTGGWERVTNNPKATQLQLLHGCTFEKPRDQFVHYVLEGFVRPGGEKK